MALKNFTKNVLGTVSFDGKFDGMRKSQDFIVYPVSKDSEVKAITIQSDTRIGFVDLNNGRVMVTPSFPSGAYNHHLSLVKYAGTLPAEELLLLKGNIMATTSAKAGSHGVTCDNSAALDVFSH